MLYRVVYPPITQSFYRIFVICVICGLANAQQLPDAVEGFVSGIKANAIKGDVIYQREDAKFPVESGLKLEQGDFIRSAAGAYAELLLQPGNLLRVAGETECQIVSDQHDKMRLKLNNGSITLELLSRETNWTYPMEQGTELIRVITPDAEVFMDDPGVFRINTTPGGHTELVVREGEAVINGRRVKKNKRAIVNNASVTIAEIDARIEDNFDTWSRERAEKLVQQNKLLKKQAPWSKSVKKGDVELDLPDDDDQGDNTRGRVISARPGAVNFVEDGVELGHDAKEWQPLTDKSPLTAGDKLRTAAHSLAELMLFPDMYLRIDASSEVVFDELSNDSISVKVVRGSAIFDITRFDRKLGAQIKIGGSTSSATINEKGLYRIDARATGNTITVREGKVMFNDRSVDSCKKIDGATISDCEKKLTDNFDFWSQYRGEGGYNGRVLVPMVTRLTQVRHYFYKHTGFWYRNPGQTSYTFVPYSSEAFRSPYGGNYSTVLSPRSSINRYDGGSMNPRRRRPEIMRPPGPDTSRPNR